MKKISLLITASLLSIGLPLTANAAVFKCKNEAGEVMFQSNPCPGEPAILPENKSTAALTTSALIGSWAITGFGDIELEEAEVGEDVWVFTEKTMEVITSGKSLRPDSYTLSGNKIDLGYSKYTIVEFNGTTMKVKTLGIVQYLKKIK
ncbi:DUF4124 domain-containing protein [Parendozoicomonas haliclonae]|uniref:DUF4124 domain-containing protein n=1 Tax=Parendozoicomonas haliclonae TaxID=1960125 RepID=A0A1X7ALJ6_9GAMM|nr:DUF4124 domain-containing protein [Parendozoicomonas haliclonae]SMA48890.1 hypothetical protein EHSB41UT_02955 [Parendozoicomonas haliclonae]